MSLSTQLKYSTPSFFSGVVVTDFFRKHPASVGETYWQHMAIALQFAGALFMAACAALIHAFFPAWFEKTASGLIVRLHSRMVLHRVRGATQPSPDRSPSGA